MFLTVTTVFGGVGYTTDKKQYTPTPPHRARLAFMTAHAIEETVYRGEFMDYLQAYRNNNTEAFANCQKSVIIVCGAYFSIVKRCTARD